MLLGNVVIYLVGVPWLMAATGFDVSTALAKGVYPFLVGDLLKLALAGMIFPAAWWLVGRGDGTR
jgi:biotin transport system substrate-specific component